MNDKTIRELALEAAQGSAPAFQELYRRTRQGAWFVALSITKNEHDAQDILQESYLQAFKSMGRLSQPESFAPWLNQIVANKAKNYISKKKSDCFAQFGDENAADFQEETDTEFIPDEHLDQAEAKALIASLVSGLPEDQRLVVLLRYYDDMEVAAIAKSLEVPEGTVKSRLSRARQKLAAMLEQAQGKGLKLYAMAPIPLLAYFIKLLGFDAPGSDRLPPLLIGSAAAGTAAAGGAAAAGAARKAALAGKLGAISGKAAAFAAATVVTVGGISAAGVYAYHKANPPAVIIAATSADTTGGETDTQTAAAQEQFPALVIPGSDGSQAQESQAPQGTQAQAGPQTQPASTQAPPSRAENSVGGAAQANTQTTKPPATTRSATRSTASATRAPWSLTPFPTLPSFPQITTRPRTTDTTEQPTTTEPVTTTEPPATTEQITTTEPAVTTEPPTTKPDFEYQRDINGGYVINKFNGSQPHVVVPSSIDGTSVIHLGASLFEGTDVVRVELSPGIDCIRSKSFANCPGLVEVVVPPSVVTMSYSDSFAGSPNVVIVCTENSRAHNYAKTYGIAFRLV